MYFFQDRSIDVEFLCQNELMLFSNQGTKQPWQLYGQRVVSDIATGRRPI